MSLLPIDDALTRLLSEMQPLPTESIPLDQATDRILAMSIRARLDHPIADNSAMDGFALRAEDGCRPRRLLGQSAAGRPQDQVVGLDEAVRIFTGGLVPPGANAVLIQEDAQWDTETCQPLVSPKPGAHIRTQGEDFAEGDLLMQPGQAVRAMDLALLGSQGLTDALVYRRPRVVVIATGDELVEPGQSLGLGQIYESNTLMVAAQVQTAGGEIIERRRIADDPEATTHVLKQSVKHADLVIFCGGASVGDHDHVVNCLQREAVQGLDFYKVKMKPGKPVAAARIGHATVLCLPGNPASSAVAFEQFVRPCLRRLQGDERPHRRLEKTSLRGRITGPQKRCRFLRARRHPEGGVAPFEKQGSGMLSSLLGVDGLIMVPAGLGPLLEGDAVAFQAFDGPGDHRPPEAQWGRLFS